MNVLDKPWCKFNCKAIELKKYMIIVQLIMRFGFNYHISKMYTFLACVPINLDENQLSVSYNTYESYLDSIQK